MINALTTKLEIDIMQANELDGAIQLAVVHKIPTIVVHPQLVQQAIMNRIKRNCKCKIMTTIDWPKGDIYGITKLRGITRELMDVDGYEILMTGGKTELESKNEAKAISEFIRMHIGPRIEIRFVLGCQIRDEVEFTKLAKVMPDVQSPSLLRTDTHLRTQITKSNLAAHTKTINAIKAVCGLPLKISGNIDNVRIIAGCLQANVPPAKFAVNLQQLQSIIKDLQNQPNELRELLSNKQAANE